MFSKCSITVIRRNSNVHLSVIAVTILIIGRYFIYQSYRGSLIKEILKLFSKDMAEMGGGGKYSSYIYPTSI